MRDVSGRPVPVNGRTVHVEESGRGQDWVVFEAGGGCGRTCWDPVLPLLTDEARLVAYDRAERFRERVTALGSTAPPGGRVRVTGPWAPYSFAEP